MTKQEVSKIVLGLIAAYPSAKLASTTGEVYERLLVDLEYRRAAAAVKRIILTHTFFPAVAEIRKAYFESEQGSQMSGLEAWAVVLKAIRRFGRYEEPAWANPLVGRAVELWGSWQQLCDSPEDDAPGRARFVELYETLQRRHHESLMLGALAPKAIPALQAAPRNVIDRSKPSALGELLKSTGGPVMTEQSRTKKEQVG